jgi:hypothetical protein
MRKLLVTVTATSVLVLGSAFVVEAGPVGLGSARDRSLVERIGCRGTGDSCSIGSHRVRHESGKWSCVPCGYGDRDYDHRHYDRDYDRDRYYEPRRYPREYY